MRLVFITTILSLIFSTTFAKDIKKNKVFLENRIDLLQKIISIKNDIIKSKSTGFQKAIDDKVAIEKELEQLRKEL